MKDNSKANRDQVRLFIGIKIPLAGKSLEIYSKLKSGLSHSSINWVPTDNVHLTLKFIGNSPAYLINSIGKALSKSVSDFHEFNLVLRSIGFFGKPNPTVVWIGMEDNPLLQEIFKIIETNLFEAGIEKETRKFSPHITSWGQVKYGYAENIDRAKNQIKFVKVRYRLA